VGVHLAPEGLNVKGFHRRSAVQNAHEPADAEEGQHKPAEALRPIPEPFTVAVPAGQAKNDTRQQREEKGSFEMIQIESRHVVG
jgi:hypothetical protein